MSSGSCSADGCLVVVLRLVHRALSYAQLSFQPKTQGDPMQDFRVLSLSSLLPSDWLPSFQIPTTSIFLKSDFSIFSSGRPPCSFGLSHARGSRGYPQTESWGDHRTHLFYFSFLSVHSPGMLLVQCLKTVAPYVFSSFLVVYGERAGPVPLPPSWHRQKCLY